MNIIYILWMSRTIRRQKLGSKRNFLNFKPALKMKSTWSRPSGKNQMCNFGEKGSWTWRKTKNINSFWIFLEKQIFQAKIKLKFIKNTPLTKLDFQLRHPWKKCCYFRGVGVETWRWINSNGAFPSLLTEKKQNARLKTDTFTTEYLSAIVKRSVLTFMEKNQN